MYYSFLNLAHKVLALLVVVASYNPVKVAAVRRAFADRFGSDDLQVESVDVPSDVDDQPQDDAETRKGANNRANNAQSATPDADYYVGLEGGVETINNRLMAFAWMAILARDGRISESRTLTLPLPNAVRDLIADGVELGDANDRVFATKNSKQKGGAFGLLTDGRLTREDVYAQALMIALVPFVHEAFIENH